MVNKGIVGLVKVVHAQYLKLVHKSHASQNVDLLGPLKMLGNSWFCQNF